DIVTVPAGLCLGARAKAEAAGDRDIANRNIVIHVRSVVGDVQGAVGVQFHLHRNEDGSVVGAGGIGPQPVKSFRQHPAAPLLDDNSRSSPGTIPLSGTRTAPGRLARSVRIAELGQTL